MGFETIRQYLNAGFEIEENVPFFFFFFFGFDTLTEPFNYNYKLKIIKIAKRQRFCTGTARGISLSIVYDFLILTHEYLTVFKKPQPGGPHPRSLFEVSFGKPKRKEKKEKKEKKRKKRKKSTLTHFIPNYRRQQMGKGNSSRVFIEANETSPNKFEYKV